MSRPVQIVLLLAAFFSLRLNDFFPKNSFAKSGNALAASVSGVHARAGENLDNSVLTGPGLQIIDFQANRTTFGFQDEGYTQPFDPTLANRKVALGCDSIQLSMTAVVNAISVSDSLGFRIAYGNPDGSASTNQLFLFDSGQIRFTNGGGNFNCNILPSAMTVNTIGGQKSLNFNLNACLAGLGLTLQPGDTIAFSGNFVVNHNGPLGPQFNVVPNFEASAFTTQNGALLSCDTLFETFTVAKSEVVFDFPNTINGLPNGCAEGELDWRLFVPDNDFSDYFGSELRASTKVDSLVFDFDPGLLSAFTGGAVEVSIPGHPQFGDAYYPIRPLSDFPDGHYVAKFDTLTSIPSLNLVQNYTFDLRVKLTPTCESPVGSVLGDNVYDIQSSISYTDRYYANFIGNGGCVNVHSDQANSAVAYNMPPMFSLTPLTPAAATLTNGLATWDVRICNTASQADAGVVWMALEDPSGLLNIGAIANITNPGVPVPLTLTPYGQNSFAFLPAFSSGQCMTFRIVSSTSSCDDVALNIRTGWNCSAFPLGWTPDQNAPCSSDYLPLTLVNTGASAVQVSFTDVSSVCNGLGESVTISGKLTSSASLPNDNYTISYIFDENANGIVETSELVLAQQTIAGAITPSNPLIFNQLINTTPAQACQILVKIESLVNSACTSFSAIVPVPTIHNAGSDRTFCGILNQYTTTLGNDPCDTMLGYKLTWTAIPPALVSDLSDTLGHSPTLSFDPTDFLGQTLRFVLSTERTSCGTITYDTVSVVVPADANGVFSQQQLDLQVADCQSNATFCAELSALLFPNYIFTDNGQPYAGGFTICSNGFNLQVPPGIHELVATDTVAGCSDTVLLTVTCTSTETLQVGLLLGESDTICLNSGELSGAITSLVNVCQDGQFVDYQLLNDSCLVVYGDLVGQETACLVACDANGFCDTTLLNITVSRQFPNGIKDTVTATQSRQYCFDDAMLNLAGTLTTIQNICPTSSGSSVQFTVDNTGFCVDYLGLSVGTDTACVELCDNLGNCDTVSFCVSVVPGNIIYDTVFLQLETDTFCLPTAWLPGTVVSIVDICPENNGDNVNFTIEGNCILYTGFAIGADSACFRFEDNLGNVALVELQIAVRKTTPETYCDTVFVGQSKLYCLDLTELPGVFEDGTIQDICPDERTGNVELNLNNSEHCVFYSGISEGRDSACIIHCDEFGFCDTTYFCLFVKPYFEPPTLGPDFDSTITETPVVIDFLANDTIYGGIDDVYILEQPISGTVVLNLDNSFTYIPEDGACAHHDPFTYVACNPNGCDTATVDVYISCIQLTIFTAVSPNNDDVNDIFYIAKVEEFPDNHLWVYNIWGSLVYETKAYRNTWPGTWGADTDLPDGTYYYIFEWLDNGVNTVQKGYIELFR